MANQYLALSLFLMLLSFFIIMNSKSGFDQSKASPVMRSLSVAFSGKTKEQGQAPLNEFVEIALKGEGDSLERIESLFVTNLTDVQAKRNRLGNMMRIRLPVSSFARGIEYTEESGGRQGNFVPTLVALLQTQDRGIPYRMDMLLSIPQDPADMTKSDPEGFQKKLETVTGFAQKLEEMGIPKTLLSSGLQRGENGFIDIYFVRYEPFRAAQKQPESEEL